MPSGKFSFSSCFFTAFETATIFAPDSLFIEIEIAAVPFTLIISILSS